MARLDSKALGRRVRAARQRAHFATQATLAEAADVSDETISRIERGAFEPALSTLVSLADALGTTLDALVGRAPVVASRPQGPLRRLQNAADALDADSLDLLARVAERLGATSPGHVKRPKMPRRRRA